MAREFNAYELNQLIKAGIDPESLDLEELEDAPIEYVTKQVEFLGREFFIDERALIPRYETEKLVQMALSEVEKQERSKSKSKLLFADIGTGSGVVGISFAIKLLEQNIRFKGILSDVSKKALEVTSKNLLRIIQKDRRFNKDVQILTSSTKKKLDKGKSQLIALKSDLFENYPENIKFDYIFANLPYIPTRRTIHLSKSVREFEPMVALNGGDQGFEVIKKFLQEARARLKKYGVIFMEVDDTHDKIFVNENGDLLEDWDITVELDENQKNRFWVIKKNT
jgi:release factor glutamine methyltransferase